jgi:hypothetical protein
MVEFSSFMGRGHFAVCIHHPLMPFDGVVEEPGKIGPPRNELVNIIN